MLSEYGCLFWFKGLGEWLLRDEEDPLLKLLLLENDRHKFSSSHNLQFRDMMGLKCLSETIARERVHPTMLVRAVLHVNFARIKRVNKALLLARYAIGCCLAVLGSVLSTAHPRTTSGGGRSLSD